MQTILVPLLIGCLGGTIAALCGVGGGIVMVPAFVLMLGMEQKQAVATSLAVIAPTAIVPKVRQLLYTRDLLDRHRLPTGGYNAFEGAINSLPASETLHFPRKKDGNISCYPHFLSVRFCKNFTVSELKSALEECLRANLRMITTQLDPSIVLSQLVTRILI